MIVYTTLAPHAAWIGGQFYDTDRQTITVSETDFQPVYTGLLSADGVPLYRIHQRGPLGFCRERLT